MLDSRFYVTNEDGKEVEMELLFTFEDNGRDFVVYFDPKDEEGNTFASIIGMENELIAIEDGEDFAAVEEAFENWMADEEEQGIEA